MKRLLSAVLASVLLFSTCPAFAAFTDMPEETQYAEAINKLTAFEIINGYEDGTFRPEHYVTRAEFAKLTVNALGKKEMANQSASGLFSDVSQYHWANGYINFVADNAYIKGYPDGTFHPDEYIPFDQVITILVRMLGYTTEDVGYHWPRDYIQKGSALGITEGLWYSAGDLMTRKDIALLLDRTLDTDMNSTPKAKLIDSIGFMKIENATIIATKAQDASLASDELKTNTGTVKFVSQGMEQYLGKTGNIYLNKDSKAIYMEPNPQTEKSVVVNSLIDNNVSYLDNGSEGIIKLNDDTVIYSKGQRSTLVQMKSLITQGTTLKVYYNEAGSVEYVLMDEAESYGPFTVTKRLTDTERWIEGVQIRNDARIFRNGIAISFADIKIDDILYYTPSSNVVMVYDEKRTGVYEEAYPSKAFVESISLSGVTYEIESTTALNKLNESAGAYKKKDKITILLGKDGKIADVKTSANISVADLGVVLTTYSEISTENDTKGKKEFYIKVLKPDGNEYSYKADRDFESYIGSLVEMEVDENGLINKLNRKTGGITGELDKANRKIGKYSLSRDCKIIELLKNHDGEDAQARILEWEDITLKNFTDEQVIYAQRDNEFGDITLLYVNNVSNDGYLYGILKKRDVVNSGMMVSGKYTVDIGGTEYNFATQSAYSIGTGTPVGIDMAGNSLDRMFALENVGSGSQVKAVDYDRIKVDSEVYTMAPDAVVYRRQNNDFTKEPISLNELTEETFSNVTLYADSRLSLGGKVRVIVVR